HPQQADTYHPWYNSVETLNEFGVGIGLYFRQLLYMGSFLVLMTLVYLPSMIHNYSFNPEETPSLLLGTVLGAERDDLSYGKNGVPDLIATVLLLVFAVTAKKAEDVAVERIDKSQQTPSDYTVCIHNPPAIVRDPDAYHVRFKKYGDIAFVTIALNNGELLKAIAHKEVLEHKLRAREAARSLASAAKQGSEVELMSAIPTNDSLPDWKLKLQPLGLFQTVEYLEADLAATNSRIVGLSKRDFRPSRVYITFNLEQAQVDMLAATETGLLEEVFNLGKNKDSIMEGKTLHVTEAEEPSEVIWANLHFGATTRVIRLALSLCLSVLVLYVSFAIVSALGESNIGFLSAIFISVVNGLLPFIMKQITWNLEIHKSSTDLQFSMMLKLVAARCVNSAFLLWLSTSFEDQFSEETITEVVFILLADAFVTPLMRLANLWDRFMHAFVAPKAKTQAEMNFYFQGAYWELAERYTDAVKTVFVGLFYASIVPTGVIITSFALIMSYWVDKISLFRLWRRPPLYDNSLAVQSRWYMFLTLWIHLIITRVFFANWPYLDEADHVDCGFFNCGSSDALTSAQSKLVRAYSLFGTIFFISVAVFLFLYYCSVSTRKLLIGKKSTSDTNLAPYRTTTGIDCYVPLVKPAALVDPLFGIDVGGLPENAQKYLPLRMGGYYNAERLSMNTEALIPDLSEGQRAKLFATVKYYTAGDETLKAAEGGGFLVSNQPGGYVPTKGVGSGQWSSAVAMPAGLFEVQASHPSQDGLPPGWEQRQTETGRVYYVNHAQQSTQWARPTVVNALNPANLHTAVSDLPLGWEARYTETGRPYYVNHNSQETTWEHPRMQRQHRAGNRGHAEGANTGNYTTPPHGRGSGGGMNNTMNNTVNSTVNSSYTGGHGSTLNSSQGLNSTGGSVRTSRVDSRGSAMVAPLPQQAETIQAVPALPSYLEQRMAADGRMYYVNHLTKKTVRRSLC
ncbi:unnamed protein product, partial [Chrysoparadoxa australica]